MSTDSTAKLQQFLSQLQAMRSAGARGGQSAHAGPIHGPQAGPAPALEGEQQRADELAGGLHGTSHQGWTSPALQAVQQQPAAPQQASWQEQEQRTDPQHNSWEEQYQEQYAPLMQEQEQQQEQQQQQEQPEPPPQQAAAERQQGGWGGAADVIDLTADDPAGISATAWGLPAAQLQQSSPWDERLRHHYQQQQQRQIHPEHYQQQQEQQQQQLQDWQQAYDDYKRQQQQQELEQVGHRDWQAQQQQQGQQGQQHSPYKAHPSLGAELLEEERRLLALQHSQQGQQAQQGNQVEGHAVFDSSRPEGSGGAGGMDPEAAVLLTRRALQLQGSGGQSLLAKLQAMRQAQQAQQAQQDGRQHPMLQPPSASAYAQSGNEGGGTAGSDGGKIYLALPSQQAQHAEQQRGRVLPRSLLDHSSGRGAMRGYQPATQLVLPASAQQQAQRAQQADRRTVTTGGMAVQGAGASSSGHASHQGRFAFGMPSYLRSPQEDMLGEDPSAAAAQQAQQGWPQTSSDGNLTVQAVPRRLPATLTGQPPATQLDVSSTISRYMGTGALAAAAAVASRGGNHTQASHPGLLGLGVSLQPHLSGGAAGLGLQSFSNTGAGLPGNGGIGMRPVVMGALGYEGRPAMSAADNRAALRACMDGLEAAEVKEEMDAPEGVLLVPLMRHQKLALAWMARRELGRKGPVGGILADDQGLGKTVSTIALIVTNRPDANKQGSKRSAAEGAGSRTGGEASKRARSGSRASLAFSAAAGTAGAAGAPGGVAGPSAASASGASAGGAAGASGMDEGEGGLGGSSSLAGAGRGSEGSPGGDGSGGSSSGSSSSSEDEEDEVIELDCSGDEAPSESKPINFMPQGGTLVVCPTTVLHQWASEIKAKTNPSAGITVHTYHGKGKLPSPEALARYAVVLTTYATLAMEAPTKGAPVRKKKAAAQAEGAAAGQETGQGHDGLIDLSAEPGAGEESPLKPQQAQQQSGAKKPKPKKANEGKGEKGGPLFQVYWHRVVLDEAQCIKNKSTLAAHAAWSLRASRRWCLSGTPMQNSVDDLYSYFRFLRHAPWSDPTKFKELIKDPIASNPEKGFRRLQGALMGVVLRRTKQTKIDGEPVVKLPERRQAQRPCDFSKAESEFYQKLAMEASEKMKRFQAEGTVRQNYVSILWMLLRLRQACNHPWLVKGAGHHFQHHPKVESAQVHAVQKLAPDLRQALSSTLREHLTECVVCGDVPEDPVVSVCNHVYCAQCVSSQISTAGHGAAEAELAFHCPACGHTLGKHDTFSEEAFCAAAATASVAAAAAGAQPDAQGSRAPGSSGKGKGKPGGSGGGGQVEDHWQSSAKIEALMELLRGLRDNKPGAGEGGGGEAKRSVLTSARSLSHAKLAAALKRKAPPPPAAAAAQRLSVPMEKVIVFSQWTGMLDLVEIPLKKERFAFRRLDGTMSVAARQAAISDFSKKADVGVMLVSLKAASVGVNLVSANHVVLLDPWWNPTVEEQAIDRAHRIGQTKTVHVTRIVIKGTVEDKILELQEKKRRIVAAAFGEEGGAGGLAANKLSEAELLDLFQV